MYKASADSRNSEIVKWSCDWLDSPPCRQQAVVYVLLGPRVWEALVESGWLLRVLNAPFLQSPSVADGWTSIEQWHERNTTPPPFATPTTIIILPARSESDSVFYLAGPWLSCIFCTCMHTAPPNSCIHAWLYIVYAGLPRRPASGWRETSCEKWKLSIYLMLFIGLYRLRTYRGLHLATNTRVLGPR